MSIVALAGCATTQSDHAGLVCPDCRIVKELNNYNFENYGYAYPEESIEHQCPGCQGALTTLLTEGRLAHSCTRCDGTPYTCSISNR